MKTVLRALAAAMLLATAPLCAFAAHDSSDASLTARVHHHPLYPMLLQLDRQIAALTATIAPAGLAFLSATVTADTREADRDLAAGAARERAAAAGAPADAHAETAALSALAGRGDSAGTAAYRSSLLQTTNAALATYARALGTRVDRAYARRAAQFDEAESTLAYQLDRRDAGVTLPLRVKLADLRPDAETQATLRSQLATILALEARAVAALHAKNQAVLAAYRAELLADSRTDYARESALASHDVAANLRARLAVAGPAPGAAPPAWHSFDTADAGRLREAAGAFEAARAQIARRSQSVAAGAGASTRDTEAQIASLRNERRALYAEIVAQIERTPSAGR